jgi:hypothetical protein
MWDFKRDIFRVENQNGILVDLCYDPTDSTLACDCGETVILDPFDYMIVTYQYRFDDFRRDLDSATAFQNTGNVIDSRFVGCGQPGGYIVPAGRNINTAYLFQAGDDVGNGLGESIVINFKNVETDAISLNDNVRVELYAGWCLHAPQQSGDITNVSVTSYSGGTMSIVNNVVISDGTIVDGPFVSNNIPVISGCCSVNPVTQKTHIGTINYNLATKVSNISFY